MSTIWTRCAGSEWIAPLRMTLWRVVEHQASISTRALTDSLAEQERLEVLLEKTKPAKPDAAPAELHYLLHTPFRYFPADGLARFSSPRFHSHFYGAEVIATALAEYSFHQWCVCEDMDTDTRAWVNEVERTVFSAAIGAFRGIDLTQPPFVDCEELYASEDYGSCQALADVMQQHAVAVARYHSVRDPQRGHCGVVFNPEAFAHPEPLAYQTWNMRLSEQTVEWVSLTPRGETVSLHKADFLIEGRLPRPGRARR